MRSLSILEPLTIPTLSGTLPLVSRLLTPNPREASGSIAQAGTFTIDIDLGAQYPIDTFFLGYAYGSSFPTQSIGYGPDGYSNVLPLPPAPTRGAPPARHYFAQLDAPIAIRFVRFTLNLAAGARFGCLALGAAFTPRFGQEWGAGRFVTDTGSATRLRDGSFGVDEGVGVGGYGWTLGDLSAAEVDTLYLMQRRRRTTRSILVTEDPELSDGLNERLHWGLFQKLDAYARLDPNNTKWDLQVGDWG